MFRPLLGHTDLLVLSPRLGKPKKRQCLRLPGYKDENMLVLLLAALDQYRNGKTGTLTGINITAGNEKIIIDQFNVTGRIIICRKDSDDNGLLPCPTVLWIGELSLELRLHLQAIQLFS